LITYNLYDRVWKIELDNAKVTMDDKSKNITGPLRFMAMPFTDKAAKCYDDSLVLHDDIAAITGINYHKYGQLLPDLPKDKRYMKMSERYLDNNEYSRPMKRSRKKNN
jgi:hypothetical protein